MWRVSVLTSQKYVPLPPPVAATRTHPAHPAAGAAVYLMLEDSAQRISSTLVHLAPDSPCALASFPHCNPTRMLSTAAMFIDSMLRTFRKYYVHESFGGAFIGRAGVRSRARTVDVVEPLVLLWRRRSCRPCGTTSRRIYTLG